jgi:hypothetical protein
MLAKGRYVCGAWVDVKNTLVALASREIEGGSSAGVVGK